LELKAIPIFLEPTDNSKNFMNGMNFLSYVLQLIALITPVFLCFLCSRCVTDPLWRDYPGPVLRSWLELDTFLQTMTSDEIDTLQETVASWYMNFKLHKKQQLGAKLAAVFNMSFAHEDAVFLSPPQLHTDGILAAVPVEAEFGKTTQKTHHQPEEVHADENFRILKDLQFDDIPKDNEFTTTIQSLLYMIIKLEAKVALLESEVRQLKE
jgi:hypothetical protein